MSHDAFILPEGWEHPDQSMAKRLLAEFQRELPSGHLLDGVAVETFAWSRGIDDVLFRHRDKPDHFTIIHLTWLGRTEIDHKHPTVEWDGSFSEFLAYDHDRSTFLQNEVKYITVKR
jgi:hypothetical protein